MTSIGLSELWLSVLLSLLAAPPVGVTLPDQPPPDPAAEAARFEAVSSQLDQGGIVHAYLSVDGDLTAIAGFVKSFMDEMRKIEPDVPPVNVPALLRVTGLDAVSAIGFSSVRTEHGFRNKTYLHSPEGRKGLLLLLGKKSTPFESLTLAPAGSDFVIEQDLNLKTLYESIVEGAGVQMGEQGKAMVQMALKQPLHPAIPFTMEKVMADLDTKLTAIIDADRTKMVNIPGAPKELKMPQLSGAVLIDGLGWIANELIKVLETMLAHPTERPLFAKIVRNPNWVGVQLAIEPEQYSVMDAEILELFGSTNPVLVHHLPSGKLVLASGLEFADKLFAPKPGLGQDPAFLKTMKDLPMEGTALTYASPVLFSSLRQFSEKANQLSNDKEHEQDDRLIVSTLINLLLPQNAQGEGRVTTSTKDGILTIANSAHSHKTSFFKGLASPFFTIGMFTVPRMRGVGRQEFHAEDLEPHFHEHHNENPRRVPNGRDFEKTGD